MNRQANNYELRTANYQLSLQRNDWFPRIDLLRIACFLAAVMIVATLGLMLYEILSKAWPAINIFGWRFIIRSEWQPNRDLYGVLPMVIGTLTSSLIALLLALPLGLAIAIFLSENFLPKPVRHAMRFIIDLLAAIPSVVYGLWGIFVIVPLVQKYGTVMSQHWGSIPIFKGPAYGNSLLAASLVLTLMVLPTITSISRAALVAVPMVLREGSYALGATRWETIFHVLLPCSAQGIVAAAILGFGRAMGETMAVAMLIGNSQRWTLSLFSPSNTLSALLANQFAEADGLQINALMYAALLLIIMTLVINLIGELVLKKTQKSFGSH